MIWIGVECKNTKQIQTNIKKISGNGTFRGLTHNYVTK